MPAKPKEDNEVTEIRERYKYALDQWRDIRTEASIDMRYLAGDPWSDADKSARKAANRPMLVMDELNQYTNQIINQLRQNKRGIKIIPRGAGANDKMAEFYQNRIRSIEYESNAQENAYIPGFTAAVSSSMGFWRVTRRYVGQTFDQDVILSGITNPDAVVYDPDVKEADWSDAMYAFVCEPISKKEYKRRYPKAKVRNANFDGGVYDNGGMWMSEEQIILAEYWKAEVKKVVLLLCNDQKNGQYVCEKGDFDQKSGHEVLAERDYDKRTVKNYIVNGYEILGETDQPGTYIPIVPCIGKEMYRTVANRTRREIFSAIRLARDPYMLYCFLASQEAEEARMAPRAPFVGITGQFESDRVTWESLNNVPYAFAQYDAKTDATGEAVLPPPQRPQFQPNFQTYEIAKQGARNGIQAAMGISPLPTAAQRRNEKSGVALERIQQLEAIGSFHFIANYDRALNLTGRILLEQIQATHTGQRQVALVAHDETRSMVQINSDSPDQNGEIYRVVDAQGNPEGDYGVTISTGPSYQSQREAAMEVGTMLLQELANLPLTPPQKAQLLAMNIKLQDLGPLGDEMVKVITPDQGDPMAAQQQLAAAQQQIQQAQQLLQQQHMIIETKQVEQSAKIEMVKIQEMAATERTRMQETTKMSVAQMQASKDANESFAQRETEQYGLLHKQAHERGMQAQDHQHEKEMAAQQAAHAQDLAAQQGDQQAALQQQAAEQDPSAGNEAE